MTLLPKRARAGQERRRWKWAWQAMMVWLALLLPLAAQTQKTYTYVGRIESDSFLLAWGTTDGWGNTIGRSSVSLGKATVTVAGRRLTAEQNWVEVRGLQPDSEYSYQVKQGSRILGEGTVRTYPKQSRKLAFFVIGDYGAGKPAQYDIAAAMARELAQRARSDNPVRFILTTGDNIYSSRRIGLFSRNSGDQDRHWGPKFFQPYERILAHIPFYPTLGNHDVEGSELDGDLNAYLDNFFFPTPAPARHYRFSYAGLADFWALDTTDARSLSPAGAQFRWLKESLAQSQSLWRIAYFHHPPFNAGPGHEAYLSSLRPVVQLLGESGVRVVFNGHEHNFQFSRQDAETGNALYVISGAGGQLRTGNVRRNLERAHIAGWAAQNHFLLVEIEDRVMRITPLSSRPVVVTDKGGRHVAMPLVVRAPERDQSPQQTFPAK